MPETVYIKSIWYEMGTGPTCPRCGKPNMCDQHRYVYANWYQNYRDSMLDDDDDEDDDDNDD